MCPKDQKINTFQDYAKAFDYVDHNTLWKIFKEMGITRLLPASWETCMHDKKQQLELDMEQRTGSNLEKEYVKAVYCHPVYLISVHSTSCEMPGWMKYKLEPRLPGEISIISDMQMTPPYGRKWRGTKEESEKAGLKLSIQKTKIMASGPITSWQI